MPRSRHDSRWTVAIVGSGPAGCYVGQFLAKALPQAEVTIFEALPTPYGLIRYGVAADHQGTKGVTRQFDRLFSRSGVRFAGNVAVGRDVLFDELVEVFDIVVLATGLPRDRTLGVPQDPGARIVGAGALLRALNCFPAPLLERELSEPPAALGRQVTVVGMGNVAIDVVRLLSKSIEMLQGSDIDDAALDLLRSQAPCVIDVVGRSPATRVKFDAPMLREVLALPNVDVTAEGIDADQSGSVVDLLHAHGALRAQPAHGMGKTQVRLHFGVVPEAIEERDGWTVLRARNAGGAPVEFVANTMVTALGFTHADPGDPCSPTDGWQGQGVYRVGWLRRGSHGAIPDNRKDARDVADEILAAVASGRLEARKSGFAALAPEVRSRLVTFEDWQRIDRLERERSAAHRCRHKVGSVEEMLAIAGLTPSVGADI